MRRCKINQTIRRKELMGLVDTLDSDVEAQNIYVVFNSWRVTRNHAVIIVVKSIRGEYELGQQASLTAVLDGKQLARETCN